MDDPKKSYNKDESTTIILSKYCNETYHNLTKIGGVNSFLMSKISL